MLEDFLGFSNAEKIRFCWIIIASHFNPPVSTRFWFGSISFNRNCGQILFELVPQNRRKTAQRNPA